MLESVRIHITTAAAYVGQQIVPGISLLFLYTPLTRLLVYVTQSTRYV